MRFKIFLVYNAFGKFFTSHLIVILSFRHQNRFAAISLLNLLNFRNLRISLNSIIFN